MTPRSFLARPTLALCLACLTRAAAAPLAFAQPAADDPSWQSYLAHVAAAEGALAQNEPGRAARWLDGAPAGHRGWEWRRLHALCDDASRVFEAGDDAPSLSMSPSGDTLAVGSGSGPIRLLDLATGSLVQTLEGHAGAIYGVRFDDSGRRLISASADRTARVWDTSTGRCITTFADHRVPVTAAIFLPGTDLVASCNYERVGQPPAVIGTVHLWDAATGAVVRTLRGGEKPLTSMALSPDGGTLVCGSWDTFVFAWDLRADGDPRPIGTPPPPDSDLHVDAVSISPDGELVAAADDTERLRVWRLATGEMVFETPPLGADLSGVAFSPDGSLVATAGDDDLVRLWETQGWTSAGQLRGHTGAVRGLAWSGDSGTVYSGSSDGTVRAWDARARDHGQLDIRFDAATYSAVWSPDGSRLATCAYDGRAAVYDARTGERILVLTAHPDSTANTIRWSPDGSRLVTASWDKSARVFDARTGDPIGRVDHPAGVACAVFGPGSVRVATACNDGVVRIIDPELGTIIHELMGHTGVVNSVSWSADGRVVASAGADGTGRLWDPETGLPIAVLTGHGRGVQDAAVSPDGRLVATASSDGRVRVWDASTGGLLRVAADLDEAVYRVAWSPDGSRLAAATTECTILDPARGGVVSRWRPHADTIWHLEFSPDGSRLATCSWDGTIAVASTVRRRDR